MMVRRGREGELRWNKSGEEKSNGFFLNLGRKHY
jgi:hypothetical protein